MTPSEAIAKIDKLIKAAFGMQTEQTFEAGKLADGTVIQYSTLEPGGNIFVLGADGSQQPAPAGELEMEDGSIIVISEPGKIAEVKAKAAEEEMTAEPASAAPDYAPQITALEQENAALKKRLDHLEKQRSTYTEMFQAMHAAISALGGEDSANPTQKPKQTVFSTNKDSKSKVLDKVAAALAKL